MKKRFIKFLTAKYDTTRSRTLQLERSLKGRKGGQMLFAFKLFAGRIMEDIIEFVIVVFADPSESFIILKKRDEEAVCMVSYVEYRLYSRKLKLLSLGGGSTVVLATLMISFVVAFLSPNLDVFAATYNFTQNDWRGGADINATGGHTAQVVNGTQWTKYYSANSALVDTTTSSKMTLAGQAIVVGDTNSDFSAAGMSINFTEISGSGAAGKVILKIADGTQCDSNGDGVKDRDCS